MKVSARWLPAIIVPAVVVTGVVAAPLVAGADPGLPERSATEVLASIADSRDTAFSGTIEQSSDLGLPDLPQQNSPMNGSATDPSGLVAELLTGSHTARVFVDGTERSRVQVLDRLAERDVIRNGTDVWAYSSRDNAAVHATLPSEDELKAAADDAKAANPDTMPDAAEVPSTPAEFAQQLLAAVEPSTNVTVSGTATVAGRSAYELTLTPKTDATLVGAATLAVDSETGLPLAVSVTPRGAMSAGFQVAFTKIDFSTPNESMFEFTPPADADVTEQDVPAPDATAKAPDAADPDAAAKPTVTGEGWTTVVELPAAATAGALQPGAGVDDLPLPEGIEVPENAAVSEEELAQASELLDQLTVPVEGGRAIETTLLSIVLLDDGRVLVGAVPVEQLLAAAR